MLDPGSFPCSSRLRSKLSPLSSGLRKSPTAAGICATGLGFGERNVPQNRSPNAYLSPELGAWPIYSTSFFVNRISSVTIYKPLKSCCSVRWAKGTFGPVCSDWSAVVSEMADSQGERTVVRHLANPEPAVAATERQSLLLVGESCGMATQRTHASSRRLRRAVILVVMRDASSYDTTGRTTNEQG